MLAKKMKNTYKRAISSFQMRLETLFKVIFGKIFVYEKMFVLEALLSKASFKSANKAEVDVRLAQSVDISELVRFAKRVRFGEGKAEEMFKAGHLCFIAEKNGDIVSFVWFCFTEADVNELERKMRIGPDSAYAYAAYVVPEHRGIGMFPKVLAEGLGYLFQNGTKRVYTLTDHRNISFQRTVKKAAFRKMGEVTLFRLFKLRRYRYKGETPEDYVKLKEMFSI